jgi:hypothetical protein
MHGFIVNVFFSSSILIPAITAFVRFKTIRPDFYAFIFIIWIGLMNEALSNVLAYTIKNNSVNANIYVLAEFEFIVYQFYKWSDSSKKYMIILIGGLAVWITDNLILHRISNDNSFFRIVYSFIILFLSIDQINRLLIFEGRGLLKNAIFLLCVTFVGYYSCKAFIETFNVFYTNLSYEFRRNVFMILYIANVISNIMYSIAIVCMPSKEEFTLPY